MIFLEYSNLFSINRYGTFYVRIEFCLIFFFFFKKEKILTKLIRSIVSLYFITGMNNCEYIPKILQNSRKSPNFSENQKLQNLSHKLYSAVKVLPSTLFGSYR